MDSLIPIVKSRLDLRALASEHTRLRRAGRLLIGLCPFHEEKNASFTVNLERQRFRCYGCGAHGDVIDFVRLSRGLDTRAALEYAARLAGVEWGKPLLPEERRSLQEARKKENGRRRCMEIAHRASLLAERGLPRPGSEDELPLYDRLYAWKDKLDSSSSWVEDRETLSSFLSKLRRWRLTAEVTLRGGAKNLRPLPAITGRGAPRACRRSVIEYESHKCEEGVGDSNFCGPGAYTAGSAVFTWCQQPNKTSEGVIECHHANQDT